MKFLRCVLVLSGLGLFTANSALAQTLLINLSFDNAADRLEQTGLGALGVALWRRRKA